MESFFDNAGEIITSAASNPLGIAALVILLSGAISFWWFRHSAEWIRLSMIILLFVGGLLFAFASGIEVSTSKIDVIAPPEEPDSNTIILSDAVEEQLNQHIQETGSPVNPDTKSQIIEEALESYLEDDEPDTNEPSQASVGSNQTAPAESIDSKTVAGYKFDLYECIRTDEAGMIVCNFAISNQEEDRTLRILSQNSPESRIIDSNGVPYEASRVDFGAESSPYQADTKLAQKILIRSSLIFGEVPDEVNILALFEISTYSHSERNYSTIQFRDIEVSN
ncbi:MAG: hypothetical protein AAF528_00030 [Cyanobacteria bacterium P01_C01_bin.121]